MTLLGSDSHTPTAGGMGMVAIGAGGLDVAVAMAGGPFYITCPKVVGVKLTGRLPDWVAAKDVILKLLGILTTKGNVGWAVEYFGPAVATLDGAAAGDDNEYGGGAGCDDEHISQRRADAEVSCRAETGEGLSADECGRGGDI